MAKPAKTVAGSRGVVVPLPGRANLGAHSDGRIRPPAYLSKAQADVWTQTVAAKPADWFGRESAPMLSMYCRAVASAEHLARIVDKFERRKRLDSDGMHAYGIALASMEKQSKLVISLATKMRLTQQSQYTPKAAGTASRRGGAQKKPWEAEA